MTSWSVSPEGVRSVLGALQPVRDSLDTARSNDIHASTEAQAGLTGRVRTALDDVLLPRSQTVARILTALDRAAQGAALSTAAFLDGDEEMAASTTRAAAGQGDLGVLSPARAPRIAPTPGTVPFRVDPWAE